MFGLCGSSLVLNIFQPRNVFRDGIVSVANALDDTLLFSNDNIAPPRSFHGTTKKCVGTAVSCIFGATAI